MIQFVTTILHCIWCYIFITKYDLREKGAALSVSITWLTNIIICDINMRIRKDSDFKHMIFWYDMTVFNEIGKYLRISVPGVLMNCLEGLVIGIMAVFAGLLGVQYLAAFVIMISISAFVLIISNGISDTTSSMIQKYLKLNQIDLAKKLSKTTIILNTLTTTLLVIILSLINLWLSQLITK